MSGQDFQAYLQTAFQVMQQVSGQFAPGVLDEQAVPAYLQGNPLSRWIFRRRLTCALSFLRGTKKESILDFGCGSGLLLPYLARSFDQVAGVDITADVVRAFLGNWPKGDVDINRISIHQTIDQALPGGQQVNCILALDVLEHIDNYEGLLKTFNRRLKPDGLLIVSGPTENILYRLGRKIVGFTGEYHHHTIYDILTRVEDYFSVPSRRVVVPLIPLFVIAAGKPNLSISKRP